MSDFIHLDQQARNEALDPKQSFIVQAPAGSGKTQLLTQRYLCLLGLCQKQPESIVALTFTRKAATEMRERVITALQLAQQTNEPPEQAAALKTWQLARQVLKQDSALNWQLLTNPNRLRILTLDAFAKLVCDTSPLQTLSAANPILLENASDYYQHAVYNLFTEKNIDERYEQAIKELLLHFNNDTNRLIELLASLLSSRDQWLAHIITCKYDENLRTSMEASLQIIITKKLTAVSTKIPNTLQRELLELLNYAKNYSTLSQSNHSLVNNCYSTESLTTQYQNFSTWLDIAKLLLRKNGSQYVWRKQVDSRCGFPTAMQSTDKAENDKRKQYKDRMQAILKQLNTEKFEPLRLALSELFYCPSIHYSDKQWEILNGLTKLLPYCVAHLNQLFTQNNTMDFIQLLFNAHQLLGDNENPTDLALYLDYNIHHLLIDEFQDTSIIQLELIEKLLRGWQIDDGRSIFLVGDPMQSIYRFRNAEVSLFLQVKKYGLATIPVKPLTLYQNFRSTKSVVESVNQIFSDLFPSQDDAFLGAVRYSPSIAAVNDQTMNQAIQYCLFNHDDAAEEIKQVKQIINAFNQQTDQSTLAILVRSRRHLMALIPELQREKIQFNGIDLNTLDQSQAVQDLLTLTRALFHLGDRIAWLGLLRAPWCGLSLADITPLAEASLNTPLWSAIKIYHRFPAISDDGKKRLARLVPIIQDALNKYNRLSVTQWIKGTWLMLGGAASLTHDYEFEYCTAYFKLLDNINNYADLAQLQKQLKSQYTSIQSPTSRIHVTTIHKAKGLEFDQVILLGLHRHTASDSMELLTWQVFTHEQHSHLVLAPISSSQEEDNDPVHHYIRHTEKKRLQLETLRLLYVAMTRAKKNIHLVIGINCSKEAQLLPPKSNTTLHLLWPALSQPLNDCYKHYHDDYLISSEKIPTLPDDNPVSIIKRLPADWQPFNLADNEIEIIKPPKIDLVALKRLHELCQCTFLDNMHEKKFGVGLHETLCYVTNRSQKNKLNALIAYEAHLIERLRQLGIEQNRVHEDAQSIIQVVKRMLQHPIGYWLLDNNHRDSQCEYQLTTILDGKLANYIIDRTFIDKNKFRWIIDYKSATPNDQKLELFLQQQKKRYMDKMLQYAEIMNKLDRRPIRIGLYFPLCQGWITWDILVAKEKIYAT